MQRLFATGHVPVTCKGFTPGVEKRRGETTKIITLTLVVDPFDATLASSVDEGLGGDSNVRQSLFELSTPSAKAHLENVALSLGCARQNLHIYAAPDIEQARLMLAQVKISGVTAKRQKDGDVYALVFKASFGMASRDELEAVQHWFGAQQFVTFEEAEPGLFEDIDDDAGDDIDARPVDGRPVPMWDDGEKPQSADAPEPDEVREVAAVPAKRRGTRKKTGRHDPDAEQAKQRKAGKRQARSEATA